MYHCAVVLQTTFGPDGSSGGYPSPAYLANYFDYEASGFFGRGTNAQWYQWIADDIDANRPIFYEMGSVWGGHALVCDGYRNGNEIHLNFGWGGAYNAWYNMDNVVTDGVTWGGHSAVFWIAPANSICDPDDQISEAHPVSIGQTVENRLDYVRDVDMFSITVSAGQTIGFGVDGYHLRLFDTSGTELASDLKSYLQYTFSNSGTYFLGVSTRGNISYDPVDGTGDIAAWYNSSGHYTLTNSEIFESVSVPTSISGPSSAYRGVTLSFTASGGSSSFGHTIEYCFNWGDLSMSDWGSDTQSHTYSSAGSYGVKAQARCATDTSVTSDWSGILKTISISLPSITVNWPPSGAPWTRGSYRYIKWRNYGPVGSPVSIRLYRGGVYVKSIVTSTTNDGLHRWLVPRNDPKVFPASSYRVKITRSSLLYRYSSYFRIK